MISVSDKIKTAYDSVRQQIAERIQAVFAFFAFLREALRKPQLLLDYLKMPRNEKALKRCAKEVFRVMKAFLPKKGKGRIRLGFSDPFQTGQVMEAAALLYPCYAKHIEVIPDFSGPAMEAEMHVAGRIRLFTVARAAAGLLLDRNVRLLYRDYSRDGLMAAAGKAAGKEVEHGGAKNGLQADR